MVILRPLVLLRLREKLGLDRDRAAVRRRGESRRRRDIVLLRRRAQHLHRAAEFLEPQRILHLRRPPGADVAHHVDEGLEIRLQRTRWELLFSPPAAELNEFAWRGNLLWLVLAGGFVFLMAISYASYRLLARALQSYLETLIDVVRY